MGVWRGLLLGLVVFFGLGGTALAEDHVDVTPMGSGALSSGGTLFRTADTQPSFAIAAPEGTSADCQLLAADGSSETTVPCGPPVSGCTAPFCASYQPSSPLAPGSYLLSVMVHDEFGTELGIGGVTIDVDESPPDTSITTSPDIGDLQPSVQASAEDESGAADTLQCSLERLGTPPTWHACTPDFEGNVQAPFAVPRKHIDWELDVRAVDDLGRVDPTPAAVFFDPVPCVVTAHKVSLRRLVSSGLPVTVTCSYFHTPALELYSLGTRHRVSVKFAEKHRLPVGLKAFTDHHARFTVTRNVRIAQQYLRYYRRYRSAWIAAVVVDNDNLAPVNASSAVRLTR